MENTVNNGVVENTVNNGVVENTANNGVVEHTVNNGVVEDHKLFRLGEIHNIVYDEEQIKRFAELIGINYETHHLHIIARPKYNKTIKFKTHYMSPRTIHALTNEQFVEAVKRYEMPVGYYKDSDNVVCPVNSLVLYCTTNPRCNKKAVRKFMHEMLDSLIANERSFGNSLNGRLNSCVMASKDKTRFITVDIDDKKDLKEVLEFLKENNITPVANIETRGGYHLLLNANNRVELVFEKFGKKHTIGDISCPVPGTYQGGFPVRFVSIE